VVAVRTFSGKVQRRDLPAPSGPPAIELPESLSYRIKNKLLGPPLVREQLQTERLGKPTALAVLSSDVMSSSAYATEQALIFLVQAVGVAAYTLILPVTVAILVVLAFVTLSYLEVIRAYPKAGGAYVVSRENFGLNVAQVASAALLIDYTLTVAVSVAAGTQALASAFPELSSYTVVMSVGFVVLIAYGNLRGIREAGRAFAVPTFLFIANMAVLIAVGVVRKALGQLHEHSIHLPGAYHAGHPGGGLLMGASLFIVAKSFASAGTALTGTEAISNGVGVFRRPQARNARITLVAMSLILGTMFLGVSLLASWTHAVPYVSTTPSVLSQVATYVYGHSGLGRFLYFFLQFSTLAILVLAANTSFTGFPYLASFAAEDSFLPRQLTRRGHRLVFSNGIMILTVAAVALIVATRANVTSLIPLYAIGVFTGFTMAGAGMVVHHLRSKEPHWRRRVAINASAAVLSFFVDLIFVVTRFTEGAWLIVVLLPLLVGVFLRLHRQYELEERLLREDAPRAAKAPILERHVVLVLVDRLDLATARAIQYARTLMPDEVRAVHFVLDARVAKELEQGWGALGLRRLELELIDCPDRRLIRASLELVAPLADGRTEVSVLLPRRAYSTHWARLLHDRTAERIAGAVGQLEHVNATIVPFQLGRRWVERKAGARPEARRPDAEPRPAAGSGVTKLSEVEYRRPARVVGQVKSVRIQASATAPRLVCRLEDGTGAIELVFQGRRKVAGIEPGTKMMAEGTVNEFEGRPALLNPHYQLLATPEQEEEGSRP
jgi:amino acid transporter